MSERRLPSQPDEILRRLGSQVIPVDEPFNVEQRREQVVSALSRAIRETSERKRRSVRHRVLLGFGLAASLALGMGAAAHIHRHGAEARSNATTVSEVRGAVVVTEAGESRVLAHGSALALHALGEIETAPEAQAEIRSPKSVVHLGPATKLTVPQATSVEERYRLALGQVDVSVDKNSRITRSVVVETPNAEVVVHGTVFAVGVAARSNRMVTEVSVTRGSVWVLANGVQVAVLGPGQRWSSDPQPVISPPTPVAEPPVAATDATDPALPHEPAVRISRRDQQTAQEKASTLAEQSRMFQEAIDARNHGDDARSAELFSRLLTRYPSYEEAQVQLFRAEKRLGHLASAAAEARRYLAQHPQGFAHEEARALALNSGPLQLR